MFKKIIGLALYTSFIDSSNFEYMCCSSTTLSCVVQTTWRCSNDIDADEFKHFFNVYKCLKPSKGI